MVGEKKIHEKGEEQQQGVVVKEEGKDTCRRSDYRRGATQESL